MKVEYTSDYQKFHFYQVNRDIIPRHVDEIAKLMQVRCLPIPIIVNERHYVIDGQHTLKAREKLGLTIPYLVIHNLSEEDIPFFNLRRKNWDATDWMEYYATQGNDQYARYKQAYETHKLGHNVTMQILLGTCNQSARLTFKAGLIICMIGPRIERELQILGDIAKHTTLATKTTVVTGLRKVFSLPWYDHNGFIKRLKSQKKTLKGIKVDDGLRALERVYNFRRKSPNRFF